MVDVVTNYWQQVPEPLLNALDASRELRHPRGKLGKPLGFELPVVHDDATAVTKRIAQRRSEHLTRIARVRRQVFEMSPCFARLPLHMHAPLKWNVIVGTHPRKSWDAWTDGLKVCVIEWVLQRAQLILEFRAEPRGSRLNAGASATEPPS